MKRILSIQFFFLMCSIVLAILNGLALLRIIALWITLPLLLIAIYCFLYTSFYRHRINGLQQSK